MRTVIEMAKEAGFMIVHECDAETGAWYECFTSEIERFAALVRADEREACAKVCDAAYDEFFVRHELEYPKARYDKDSVTRTVKAAVEFVAEDVAAAIRARGNT